MQIATITGQGLRWIAALVLVLWVCIVAENAVLKHARLDTKNVLVEMRRIRDGRSIPVSKPITRPTLGTKPVIG